MINEKLTNLYLFVNFFNKKMFTKVAVDETLFSYRNLLCLNKITLEIPPKYRILYRSTCDLSIPYTCCLLPHAG